VVGRPRRLDGAEMGQSLSNALGRLQSPSLAARPRQAICPIECRAARPTHSSPTPAAELPAKHRSHTATKGDGLTQEGGRRESCRREITRRSRDHEGDRIPNEFCPVLLFSLAARHLGDSWPKLLSTPCDWWPTAAAGAGRAPLRRSTSLRKRASRSRHSARYRTPP
jgi:hypothetical protein